jgi:translation initiation factor 3 subunit C
LFGDGDDESGESESEDELRELKGRARWLKKTIDTSAKDAKDAKKEAKKISAPKAKKIYDMPVARKVVVHTEDKMTEEELDRKVKDLVGARGRRGTDSKENLRQLEVLTKASRLHGARKEIPVLMHLVSAMFDSQRGIDDYLDHIQWRQTYRALYRVVDLLELDKALVLTQLDIEELVDPSNAKLELNGTPTSPMPASFPVNINNKVIRAPGSISTFLLRLHEEYIKSVQHINPHTQEYVARLADEELLVELGEAALGYYQRVGEHKAGAFLALLIVEQVYYKHETQAVAVRKAHAFTKKYGAYADLHPAARGKTAALVKDRALGDVKDIHPAAYSGNPIITNPVVDFAQKIEELCAYIYAHGDERAKTRALLCAVFHHALHDRFHRARDLLLISRIADFIDKTDVRTQILYNRAVVTIGLCAFRLGMFQKAHECLAGIVGSRAKEFLAQGAMRSQDRDPEQEKLEKRRQMPYHMHVNPDLLETCHLTSAMLLELPLLAKAVHDPAAATQVISKQLRRYLDGYNSQAFVGPPESTREHVLAATKTILEGDWQRGYNLLANMDVWKLIPADGGVAVKALLMARVQEEAIRCYLLVNAHYYDSISLVSICDMFDLQQSRVKKVICRMIFNKELGAAWEPASTSGAGGNVLLLYRTEPSKLQHLAVTVADKLTQILESNERIVDSMADVYGYKDDWKSQRGEERKNWQQQGQQGHQGERKGGRLGLKSGQRPTLARGNPKNAKGRPSQGRSAWGSSGGSGTGGVGGGSKYRRDEGGSQGQSQGYRRPNN